MQRDLRFYFSGGKKESQNVPVNPKKRRVISSDEDDTKTQSPVKRQKIKKKSNKNSILSDSDGEEKQKIVKPSRIIDLTKEEEHDTVLPSDIFGKQSIKRKEATKIVTQPRTNEKNKSSSKKLKSQKKEAKSHADDDFEATLLQLDISEIEQRYIEENVSSTVDDSDNKEKKDSESKTNDRNEEKKSTPVKSKNKNRDTEKRTPEKIRTPEKTKTERNDNKQESRKRKHSDSLIEEEQNKDNDEPKGTKKTSKAKPGISSMVVERKTMKKKESPKKPDVFEERIEKKKQGAALYQQYLQRGGARNPDSKEVPVGADNCLAGLSFLITGVLDSLEREKAEEIIKQYGGRVLLQVSRKTDYVIVGDQPGPAKLAKAEKLNIKKISEDDLLEMIRTRPAGKISDIKQSRAKSRDRMESKSTDSEETPPSRKKFKGSVDEDTEKPEKIPSLKKDIEKITEPKRSPNKEKHTDKHTEKTVKVRSPVEKEHVETKEILLENKMKSSIADDVKVKTEAVHDIKFNVATEALVEKYRPKTMKQILGQQGDKSNAKKLYSWLLNWQKNHSGQVKHTKPSPWAKNDDGAFFKAALLSGPPGIGKTTTVQVVCQELGFDLVEFNASDTRSKRLLKEEVSELLSNTTLKDFFTDSMAKPSTKHALLMDEVDGMAGNEDRGGLQELISLIKSSDVPIICICNDRNNPKMRTLANYTFDLRFQKPRLEQIRGAMKSICFKENIDISTEDLDRLIESTNQDIRQVINHLSLFAGGSGRQEKSKKQHVNKDLKLGPWDVLKKVFSAEDHKNMSIHDKSDLFFHDYNIASLFVQENYLSAVPKAPKSELLERVANSAESLALGDIVEKSIRSNGAWSLLPMQACYSSVIPGSLMSGHMGGQINFPSWLGRNSKTNKFNRLMQEITVHARLNTGASKEAINLDYAKHLRDVIVRPLAVGGTEGVEEAVNVMNRYHLLREDLDSLVELTLWPGNRDPMQAVDSKVKAAFTRAYNKNSTAAPYAITGTTKKKSAPASQDEGIIEEDEELNSDENDDNVEFDKMIKAKKSTDAKKGKSTDKKPESKSKTNDKPAKRGKGRGRGK